MLTLHLYKVKYFFVVIVIIIGCNTYTKVQKQPYTNILTVSEYYKHVSSLADSLIIIRGTDSALFQLHYQSKEFITLQTLHSQVVKNDRIVEKDVFIKSLKDIKEDINFKLIISGNLVDIMLNQNNHGYINRFYSFNNFDNFQLVCGKDTVDVGFYHFDHTFGLSNSIVFLLGFDCEEIQFNDISLLYYDKLLSNKKLEFNYNSYNTQEFKNLPKIKGL